MENFMKLRLPIYTAMHFLVDLTCIYRLYAVVMPQSGPFSHWLRIVLLYNFLAFALPGAVGLLADRLDSSDSMAALGCVLVAAPSFLTGTPHPAVILQGVGNGLFHVGAGRRVLQESNGRYSPSGIFISSGALGVFLGTAWRKTYSPTVFQGLGALLLICACILLWFYRAQRKEGFGQETAAVPGKKGFGQETAIVPGKKGFRQKGAVGGQGKTGTGHPLSVPVLMILLVVFIRSFYGKALVYTWKKTMLISFIFVLCIAAGKALGGIAADRFGVRTAAMLSLAGAAVTVQFSRHSPVLGCLSILLFNMTMPITLTLIASYWKNYPGFAFGILMTALFAGTLPSMIWRGYVYPFPILSAVCLLSLLLLLKGIGPESEKGEPR